MQLQRRVVVTGLGVLAPTGNLLSKVWSSCKSGISGITNIEQDFLDSPITIGGRIHDFDSIQILDSKEKRRLDPFVQYGVVAAEHAILDSGILDCNINKELVGVNFGSGIGGLSSIEVNNLNLHIQAKL